MSFMQYDYEPYLFKQMFKMSPPLAFTQARSSEEKTIFYNNYEILTSLRYVCQVRVAHIILENLLSYICTNLLHYRIKFFCVVHSVLCTDSTRTASPPAPRSRSRQLHGGLWGCSVGGLDENVSGRDHQGVCSTCARLFGDTPKCLGCNEHTWNARPFINLCGKKYLPY